MARELTKDATGQTVGQSQSLSVQASAKTSIYPFAEDLEAYNRILPQGAERLFRTFEAQSEHRRAIEIAVVTSNLRQSERGQRYGFLTVLLALSGAMGAAYLGMQVLAGVIVTVTLAGGFGVFITGKAQQKNDLQGKRTAAQKPLPPGPAA